jgi:hypothetical protein
MTEVPSGTGGVAQLGERLLCKQEVIGSIPFTSTIFRWRKVSKWCICETRHEVPIRNAEAATLLLRVVD